CSFDFVIFFFQAEDGIRDATVTGVQTCALPILREFLTTHMGGDERKWSEFVGRHFGRRSVIVHGTAERVIETADVGSLRDLVERSEERRVGKEGRRGETREAWKRTRKRTAEGKW